MTRTAIRFEAQFSAYTYLEGSERVSMLTIQQTAASCAPPPPVKPFLMLSRQQPPPPIFLTPLRAPSASLSGGHRCRSEHGHGRAAVTLRCTAHYATLHCTALHQGCAVRGGGSKAARVGGVESRSGPVLPPVGREQAGEGFRSPNHPPPPFPPPILYPLSSLSIWKPCVDYRPPTRRNL